ncbi:pyridine nucleotide-disulfide oxidoreductase [Mesorhizobium sp. B3-1-3]|uniref:NAD(P)/FAD-dependent oxidoreductase n=1 Tax=unclassified Mesorhizobium TaxID=325217 RepID=UPI00112783DC|nr:MULTISPECIES: FAD-dependent oxidoreductase [unclassified Mesorhizobium]TPI56059.1 pyridine nucleotide-disulfide oxidoreductase [Mesorhizobium sp. B3-1-8]TPI63353.1 pyridine nucleotide-disulfide oxidoreductase [Mesorhizobium sp. B3-1-3]
MREQIETNRVVIIGAGQAGVSTVEALRKLGFEGEILLVGGEPYLPYQRPPLSKAYLRGDLEAGRLRLKPASWYEANQITLRLGVPVECIDRSDRAVVFTNGARIRYGQLVLATGASPRTLTPRMGGDLAGVHVIRDIEDVDRLRPDLSSGGALLIVGGGYIGLEMATVGRKFGMQVTVVEAGTRLLGRVACPETAEYIERLHLSNGVMFRLGGQLDRLEGKGRVSSALLASGERIAADCVVVGIGAVPNVGIAEAAGLAVDDGILVDAQGRTSDADIWAAGDCARFALVDGSVRLESVGNACDSGTTVAGNILDLGKVYTPQPWFWSDQYDLKLQIAGQSSPGDDVVVRRSDREGLSHWYYREGRLVAVDALSAPQAYMVGKRLLAQGHSPDQNRVADPSWPLKALI